MIHRMKAVRKPAPLVTWKFERGGPCKRGETAKSSGCIPAKKEEAAPRQEKKPESIAEKWAKAQALHDKASKLEYDAPRSEFPADDEVRYAERCIDSESLGKLVSPETRDEFKTSGRNRGCEEVDEGWWDGLSDGQKLSLEEYTTRSTEVNSILRGLDVPESEVSQRIATELTGLFDSPKADLAEPRVVFRGVSGGMMSPGATRGEGSEEMKKSAAKTLERLKSLQPGDEFSMGGFQSTSASPQVAGRFSGEAAGDLMLEIKTDRGLPIFNHSNVSSEEELLLGNDWTYKVIGVVEEARYKIHRDKFVGSGYEIGGVEAVNYQPDPEGTMETKHVLQVELMRK